MLFFWFFHDRLLKDNSATILNENLKHNTLQKLGFFLGGGKRTTLYSKEHRFSNSRFSWAFKFLQQAKSATTGISSKHHHLYAKLLTSVWIFIWTDPYLTVCLTYKPMRHLPRILLSKKKNNKLLVKGRVYIQEANFLKYSEQYF